MEDYKSQMTRIVGTIRTGLEQSVGKRHLLANQICVGLGVSFDPLLNVLLTMLCAFS